MTDRRFHSLYSWFAAALLACGDEGSMSKPDAGGSEQTPPMGRAALEAWLAAGTYRDWQCEPAPHAQRSPSPHSFNRICANDLISDHAGDSADWPAGAAAVKEIYAALDAAEPIGYAVYLKTASDSAGGANWYWYERISGATAADGLDEPACVPCHSAAGADAAHTPSAGARDLVYTPLAR